ncbi:MAG: sigma-54-dependent Fis family transcriptional regulator [Acidobacteria bacterium]|nr:sigma-54-dependent Fis family transcriptional regulator [Acidobacteriota bacterium]
MANREPMKVLVVDDEPAMREVLEMRLEAWGYEVLLAGDVPEAERLATTRRPDVVISDVVLPEASGIDLLRSLKAGDAERPVILMTAHGSVDLAVEAMKEGAHDFLTKPIEPETLRATLEELARELAERRAARRLDAALAGGAGMGALVGMSEPMREVYRLIRLVAATDAAVLVVGETGTGKELVARSIHEASRRHEGSFVAVNVAAIPEGLIESELFGHERGAFTGAVTSRAGCFETAAGGTLFLDEVAEMPLSMQPKLLRVLEDGRVRRLGGAREIPCDVRVVAATNRDARQAVADGRLREDLFYRLNVFTIPLPPLRERGDDLLLLAQHFIRQLGRKHGIPVEGLDGEARRLLEAHPWPGNVRELRNVIERAVIVARSGLIGSSHLPAAVREGGGGGERGRIVLPGGVTAAEAEQIVIREALRASGGNKAEAARRLGLDVKTIRNKLKVWGEDGEGG